MTRQLNEDTLAEQPALDWFRGLGYDIAFGPDIGPGGAFQERDSWREVVLKPRLFRALRRLNPDLPEEAFEEVLRELASATNHPDLVFANKAVYELLVRGVSVEVVVEGGRKRATHVRLFDFASPTNNEFLAVNQFSVEYGDRKARRPDIIVFVNGIPLAVFELKSPTSTQGTEQSALAQLNGYKRDLPELFAYNQILVASDLLHAVHGTITSSPEWFAEWKAIVDEGENQTPNLETLIRGMFEKERLMDIVQNFIVFEADSDNDATTYAKKMAKYHQFYGVRRAVAQTQKAMSPKGNKKIGVFWHTQGSGKTLSMVFYVNKMHSAEDFKSPTVLFLTDRKDLDDQIHTTFKRTGYGAVAKRMESIAELKKKLREPGAEIIFTTIQKFQTEGEMLTESDNLIVIADEAHRSQYKDLAGNLREALPMASFMGITGTPISFEDRDTRLVFGGVISEYRIDQSVADNATVPLYYEGRLIPLNLENKAIDEDLEAILASSEGEEETERLKRKFVRLESAVGSSDRLDEVVEDIVAHFNRRGLKGKGMVVAISRRVAVEIYKRMSVRSDAPEVAVVISKPEDFRDEMQAETSVKELERRFKDPDDLLKIAIVCDMWLTGFDVPPLHTMYIDKPLRGHTLMQAIARANRVWRDKPAGLVVDYIGIAGELKKALSLYSSDVKDKGIFPLEEAISMMQEKHAVVRGFLFGVEWSGWRKKKGESLARLFEAAVSVVIGEGGTINEARKREFIDETTKLEKLHALVMPHKEAVTIRDDVAFFQAVKRAVYKYTVVPSGPRIGITQETASAIRELISDSIAAGEAIDLFAAQGKAKPEISIFDERFLEEVKKMRLKNLAIEALRKLLRDEIGKRRRFNEERYKPLYELLEKLIEDYENGIIASSEVIEKLIELAGQIKMQDSVGIELGLSQEELALYDALSAGKTSIKDDERLKEIVKQLVKMIRRDVSIDWTNNEVIRARIRANVRLLLLQNGFAADETSELVERVFSRASALYADFVPKV